MIKEDILNLCEGRFERMVQMDDEGRKNDEALRKYGLEYNGGDTFYSSKKKNSTFASYLVNAKSRMANLLKKYGIDFSKERGISLEYNLRTKKFRAYMFEKDGKRNTEELPKEFNNEVIAKEVVPLIASHKKEFQAFKSTHFDPNDDYSGYKYSQNHLKEEIIKLI